MQNMLSQKLGANFKGVTVNLILLANTMVWYLFLCGFIKNNAGFVGSDIVLIVGVNLSALVLSAVLSINIIQKITNRLQFIIYWLVVGVFLSPIVFLIGSVSFFSVILISCAIGAYFGFGLPVVLGYCSSNVESVHRAKVSGLAVFFYCVGFALMIFLVRDSVSAAIVLTVWKLCGLIAILLLKPSESVINKQEKVSYKSVLTNRSVLLYFFPWLIFSIVNNFALPILSASFDVAIVHSLTMVENVLAGVSAIFFGFLADRFGRKRLLFFGFTLLGLGYAILGLLIPYDRGLYFYTIADGIAWGVFTTLFLFTIWGDIAGKKDSEKFFVIGFLPYIISTFLQAVFGQYVADSIMDLAVVFPFACFFLFITAIPLFLAPETLSEKVMKDKALTSYFEKAQKVVENDVAKNHKKCAAADD
jgi:MFS family permease